MTDNYWATFKASSDTSADDYAVVAFGNRDIMENELAALDVAGRKRATGLALEKWTVK